MSSSDEERQIEELQEIKKFVDNEKAKGNRMFVSGWDDDNDGVEVEANPRRSKSSEIIWAAENGEMETVSRLVEEEPALLLSQDSDGYTALHRACYNDHVDIVDYLILKGANLSARTEDGWTPLHSASHWNNVRCAVKLIENGANINAQTNGGQTPLHLAASHGASKETLELLLLNPLIEPHLKNNAGEVAYDIAKRSGLFYPLFELFEPCITELEDLRMAIP